MEQYYTDAKNNKSDINEHIETLYEYAKQVEIIAECGVREVVSSWAFIKGLNENNSSIKKLFGLDLYKSGKISLVEEEAKKNNIEYNFIEGNDIEAKINNIDLCFIDTWHIYGHLKRELNKFSKITNKYIILHDTTVDEYIGESVRCRMNIGEQMKMSGYQYHEIVLGLWPAVIEFLYENPCWKLKHRYTNNNGLTILEKTN